MNSGDIAQGLLVLALFFIVARLWDTPRKRKPVKTISSYDIAQAVARAKSKCKCNWFTACPPCSEELDRHDQLHRGIK